MLSTMGTLRLMNATLAAQPVNDYRALVCLFLYGGNDSNNTIIPYDVPSYDAYAASRGILALPRTNLHALGTPAGDGRQLALHASLPHLQPIFASGKLAVLLNVGTLVAPITKAEYLSGGGAIPPYLFSHNDQQAQWQTSVPDSAKRIGWGGRLADLLQSLNGSAQLSMNISLAGNNFFQIGNEVFQYHIGTSGSAGINEFNATWAPRQQGMNGVRQALGLSYGHLFEQEYADVLNRAISSDALLQGTLANTPYFDRAPSAQFPNPANQNLFTRSPRNAGGALVGLGAQLHMILRLIAARQALSMNRQIFFSSMGGFDTHDDQLNDHAYLLSTVGAGMADFYHATAALGLSDRVTLFTASDFNRTYSTNGKGSDHAWGSHQFVCGGAVNGGQFYGALPVLQSSGPDDTGSRGSWIPTISTDEYSATLARWFGVSENDMPLVLPNIHRFPRPNLGFMA
jgi:uncharacterized protein (DUF1501 family)